jgi:hypothetical protein
LVETLEKRGLVATMVCTGNEVLPGDIVILGVVNGGKVALDTVAVGLILLDETGLASSEQAVRQKISRIRQIFKFI